MVSPWWIIWFQRTLEAFQSLSTTGFLVMAYQRQLLRHMEALLWPTRVLYYRIKTRILLNTMKPVCNDLDLDLHDSSQVPQVANTGTGRGCIRSGSWLLKVVAESAPMVLAGRQFHSGMVLVTNENRKVFFRAWSCLIWCSCCLDGLGLRVMSNSA